MQKKQNYSKKIIAIDDGSNDETKKFVKNMEKVKLCKHKKNRGACVARNTGLERASGKYIQFLDADDKIHPAKIAKQAEILSERRGSIDVVYSDWRVVNPQTGLNDVRFKRMNSEDPVQFALGGVLITGAPLHRTEAVRAVDGFRPGLTSCQEFDLHLRMAIAGARFERIPEPLFTHYLLPNSISNDFIRAMENKKFIIADALRVLDENGDLTDERREALAGALMKCARRLLSHGYEEKGEKYFQKAYQIHDSGGVAHAYGRWSQKVLRALGPHTTEKIASLRSKVSILN